MLLDVKREGQPGEIKLIGELDMMSMEILEGALSEEIRAGAPLVMDVSELTFMDSSGLRVILQAVKVLDGAAPLVLLHPTPEVRRLLSLALPTTVPGLEIRD